MARILIVDDEPSILLVLRRTFEVQGHEVLATQDPVQALELAARYQPDAITADVMMPEVSGWKLLAELRRTEATRGIPVLMLTSLDQVDDRVRGLRGGADDYVVKPYNPDELVARVETLIRRRERLSDRITSHGLEVALDELERRLLDNEELRGVSLGRYEVHELLGNGAMGRVYRGWDPKLHRAVALKTLRLDGSRDPIDLAERTSRLRDEATAAARFSHPNIVTVYDIGDRGSAAFIAMELVEGKTLSDHLEHGPIDPSGVIALGVPIARALATAHSHELLHRDVKPGNVLLGWDSSVKVTDFGIAEMISSGSPDRIAGTPRYLAPECFLGQASTVRSDLYSFGVLLYECLTCQHPFLNGPGQNNPGRLMRAVLTNELTPITDVDPNISPRLAELVHRLLEKSPDERPADAEIVAEHFEELAEESALRWSLDPTDSIWRSEPHLACDLDTAPTLHLQSVS